MSVMWIHECGIGHIYYVTNHIYYRKYDLSYIEINGKKIRIVE